MPEPAAAPPPAKPRDRSIEARRAARIRKFERERLIVDCLNRGLPVAEIAGRIGVTEKRMRALVKEILARRMPQAPEDFAALQVSRLNEALLVAYGAMSPENLKAVALVVRIVRALDRYHGLVPSHGRAAPEPRAVAAGARDDRPKMAPQTIENTESAPEETAAAGLPASAGARKAVGAGCSGKMAEAPAAPSPGAPSSDSPGMAPQRIEKMESASRRIMPAGAASPGPEDPRSAPCNRVGARSSDDALAPRAA